MAKNGIDERVFSHQLTFSSSNFPLSNLAATVKPGAVVKIAESKRTWLKLSIVMNDDNTVMLKVLQPPNKPQGFWLEVDKESLKVIIVQHPEGKAMSKKATELRSFVLHRDRFKEGCTSFESKKFKNHFLRHSNYILYMDEPEAGQHFPGDASLTKLFFDA